MKISEVIRLAKQDDQVLACLAYKWRKARSAKDPVSDMMTLRTYRNSMIAGFFGSCVAAAVSYEISVAIKPSNCDGIPYRVIAIVAAIAAFIFAFISDHYRFLKKANLRSGSLQEARENVREFVMLLDLIETYFGPLSRERAMWHEAFIGQSPDGRINVMSILLALAAHITKFEDIPWRERELCKIRQRHHFAHKLLTSFVDGIPKEYDYYFSRENQMNFGKFAPVSE